MNHKFFIISMIIITFLLGSVFTAQARGPGRGKGRGLRGGNIGACLGELNLTHDQIAQLRQIRERHMENMAGVREKMAGIRTKQRLFLYKGENVDQEQLDELIQQGSEFWKEKQKEKIEYRKQILNLLTQEQKDKLYMCRNFGQRARLSKAGRPDSASYSQCYSPWNVIP